MDGFKITGQTAIVTGAGKGIGRSAALTLARLGANLVVNSFTGENALSVAEEINRQGGRAVACPGDVSSLEVIRGIIRTALDSFGRIDILVNNAGIGGVGKEMPDLSYEEWDRMINVDLTSVFAFCKEVLPHMISRQRGKIINISSVTGIMGVAGSVPYASAKAGVIGLSKALAKEVARHRINVNVVAPGLVDTAMSRARGIEHQRHLVLWPRIGEPSDIAYAIAYLASDAAEFITGQVLSPNGGGLI